MSKFTPGLWSVGSAGASYNGKVLELTEYYVLNRSVMDDVAICADIIDPETDMPSLENANLIAAAPDLLEALKLCYDHCRLYHPDIETNNVGESVRAAIAKAEGTTP